MKIAFNPSTVAALTAPPNNKDIIFDLRGNNIFARGVKFQGTDTNTWRDIKINGVSIGSNTLDLCAGENITFINNTYGKVTINSTWRPVVNNLNSNSVTKSLSAKQGNVLVELINTLTNNVSNNYALRNGSNATGRWQGGLACLDERNTNYTPYDLGIGLELHMINNNTNNLKDGGSYNGVFSFRPWGSGSDWTGGKAHQLSFTDNENIWHRTSSGDDSWGTWKKLAYTTDIPSSLKNPHALTISLNGISQGPYDGGAVKNINITPGSIGASASDHNHDYKYLKWLGNAEQANMNDIGRISHSSGMTYLSDPGNTIDNPMEGNIKSTSWHLYWQTNYTDDPGGSNSWVAQIVNKAGTDRWWVRSRSGGTITNGTNWTSNWRFLVTAPTSGLGSSSQPIYINNAGEVVTANSYPTSLPANGGNADTVDGYHENSFLRYRGSTSTDQEATLWNQIGIKEYTGALPDNLTGAYNRGSVISLPSTFFRFEIYASDQSSNGNGLYYRSGYSNDKKPWCKFIDSANIGSQSVNYANYLKANTNIVFGRNELQYFNQYTSVTTGATSNTSPTADWYHILRMNHANSSGYFVDLAIPFNNNRIQFRRIVSGSDVGWYRVITEEPNHNILLCDSSAGGNVGIGTTTPTQKLDVVGNIRASGQIVREGSNQMWVNGRNGALLRETSVADYHTLWSLKTIDGSWDFGEYNSVEDYKNVPVLSYITDSDYNSGNNVPTYQIKFPLASGTVALTSNISDPTKCYWANVKISSAPSTTTSPTVSTLTATSSIKMNNISLEGNNKINSNTGLYLNYSNSGNVNLCYGGGKVGIGTVKPSYKLDVNGSVGAQGFHYFNHDNNDAILLAGGEYMIHKTGSTSWSTAIQFGKYVWLTLQMNPATNGTKVVPNGISNPTQNVYVMCIQVGDASNARNGIYRVAPSGVLYHVTGPEGKAIYTTICYIAS